MKKTLLSLILGIGLFLTPLSTYAVEVPSTTNLRGWAPSGLEFAGSVIPGTEGVNYTKTYVADFDYFHTTKGLQIARLPVLWERLQPTVGGALDATYKSYIDDAISRAKARGGQVIIDIHNYGRRDVSGVSHSIGDGTLTTANFADLWSRLSQAYKNETGIFGYDLMNEPHDMTVYTSTSNYRTTSSVTLMHQAAIDAIRATGDTHWIILEPTQWAGLQNWASQFGTNPVKWWRDSLNRVILSGHYYQDSDHSGAYGGSYSSAYLTRIPSEVAPMIQWAEVNDIPFLLGEYGVINSSAPWISDMDYLLGIMDLHHVYATHWAAGQWYSSPTTLEPISSYTVDRAQMSVVSSHLTFSTDTRIATYEDFERYADKATTTDDSTYTFAAFPGAGTGALSTNPSETWEADTCGLYVNTDSAGNKWGFSGNPTTCGDTASFRLNTQSSSTVNQIVSFKYKSAPFGQDGYTVTSSQAADIWLGYQSQYWLYALQFDRQDNSIVLKRKVPSNDNGSWGGVSDQVSNKGVYYVIPTDSSQPTLGAGHFYDVTWAGLGTTTMAHDGTASGGTTYNIKATMTTIATNQVQIQLFRGGVLVASWTDTNNGTSDNGRTTQQDCDAGYYLPVTGYKASWCQPIQQAGKSGLRSDNLKLWFDNFKLEEPANITENHPSNQITAISAFIRGGTTFIGGSKLFK